MRGHEGKRTLHGLFTDNDAMTVTIGDMRAAAGAVRGQGVDTPCLRARAPTTNDPHPDDPTGDTMTLQRHHVAHRLSEMVVHNGTIYLAGQVAADMTRDIIGQTEDVLASIDRLLGEAGSDKTKILSAQIFLPDMGDFAAMNSVWERWVVPGHTPARATIEAKLANPAYRVEIMIVAAA